MCILVLIIAIRAIGNVLRPPPGRVARCRGGGGGCIRSVNNCSVQLKDSIQAKKESTATTTVRNTLECRNQHVAVVAWLAHLGNGMQCNAMATHSCGSGCQDRTCNRVVRGMVFRSVSVLFVRVEFAFGVLSVNTDQDQKSKLTDERITNALQILRLPV